MHFLIFYVDVKKITSSFIILLLHMYFDLETLLKWKNFAWTRAF